MILAIHTIFVLRENILFIDEWIEYHISIGFSKFFLYDNSGSIGRDGSDSDRNKYNFNFKEITRNIDDADLIRKLSELLKKYESYITYIVWQPTDPEGNCVYGQKESITDYITRFTHESDWTAFIDMDEFIYSKYSLKNILIKCDDNNIGKLILIQKKFNDRFNNLNIPVTQIVDCIENIDTLQWAPKTILKNLFFKIVDDNWNIHYLPVTGCITSLPDNRHLRFNHYNVNQYQLEWMKIFYQSLTDFSLNGKCYALYNQCKKKKLW